MYTSCIPGRDPEKLSNFWKPVKSSPEIPFPPIDKRCHGVGSQWRQLWEAIGQSTVKENVVVREI